MALGTPSPPGAKVSLIAASARRWRGDSSIGRPYPLRPMAEHRYDPQEIEPRWQQVWADEQHVARLQRRGRGADESYVLEMLPYPSGEPHIGHLKNYTIGDAVAHFHRRIGRRVLHPMGYDAFGLPAENHAIKTGQHPRDSTTPSIARVPEAVPRAGASRSTGRASSARTSRATTAGRSGSSSSSSRPAWPTARRPRSTGAPTTRPCSPTSRSSTAAASAAATRSRSGSSSSGSSASPTTPSGCCATSTRSSGPSTSRRCSATGSAARRAPRSRSAARSSGSTTRSSPRARTRCSARRSSSWRPSTPTCCAWPRAPSTRRRPRLRQPRRGRVAEERGDDRAAEDRRPARAAR